MKSEKDSLGDRMKAYEAVYKTKVCTKDPIIIRVDGKAFHTLTKKCTKPFDPILMEAMDKTMLALCEKIQGALFGYTQSDEISIMVYPWVNQESQAWFDNEIMKMVSISAAIATSTFNRNFVCVEEPACFDSRVFTLPMDDVNNYFIWRQSDWMRNSVQMLARSLYSHKELTGKKIDELKSMILDKSGSSWDGLEPSLKYGRCAYKVSHMLPIGINRDKWEVDKGSIVFLQNRTFVTDTIH